SSIDPWVKALGRARRARRGDPLQERPRRTRRSIAVVYFQSKESLAQFRLDLAQRLRRRPSEDAFFGVVPRDARASEVVRACIPDVLHDVRCHITKIDKSWRDGLGRRCSCPTTKDSSPHVASHVPRVCIIGAASAPLPKSCPGPTLKHKTALPQRREHQ